MLSIVEIIKFYLYDLGLKFQLNDDKKNVLIIIIIDLLGKVFFRKRKTSRATFN